MIRMQERGVLESPLFKKQGGFEPVSVLDTRSPSPSTTSSSLGGLAAAGGGLMGFNPSEEWMAMMMTGEIHPGPAFVPGRVDGSERFGLGPEDWECLLPGSGVADADDSLLRWISGEIDDPSLQGGNQIQFQNNVGFADEFFTAPSSDNINNGKSGQNGIFSPTNMWDLNSGLSFQQNFNPHPQEPILFHPNKALFPPRKPPFDPNDEAIFDLFFKAGEFILSGQFSDAQMILARLNHQIAPLLTPLQRASFYFKEALDLSLAFPNLPPGIPPSPVDGVFKMCAYKVFSEISPLVPFMNFTSNQAILEAVLGDDDRRRKGIHVIDFDIGVGAQWSSFMRELKGKARFLKITAFASPSTHHPFEIELMHGNLTALADEVGVGFQLEVVNIDSFDPASHPFASSENEVIAVNLPLWAHREKLPMLLHYVRQLSPKIVVSLERGYERTGLTPPRHLIPAVRYFETLFASIAAAVNVTSDASNKIERFLFRHGIQSAAAAVFRQDQSPPPPWRTLFASAGFSPLPCSSFAEAQAECVVRMAPVGGFRVERRHVSLSLSWQNKELLSVSSWRCL
ncbi:hypothetical protein DM860_001819 [Cuscuta australis]|uniref:Uncharacterized protein n=1 Tax=Cuscuta australis TaxID=267555 RepID=A0A328EE08_9ASTE|nr:hypothetical protein DM860_001819 [Cuscuta australis]